MRVRGRLKLACIRRDSPITEPRAKASDSQPDQSLTPESIATASNPNPLAGANGHRRSQPDPHHATQRIQPEKQTEPVAPLADSRKRLQRHFLEAIFNA
jgi:hypothetical protein